MSKRVVVGSVYDRASRKTRGHRPRLQPLTVVLTLVLAGIAGAAPFQFFLRDVDGIEHRQSEWAGKRAVVVFFTTIDCPLSNGYVPEMNRLRQEYARRGVPFYAVETNTTLQLAEIRRHAKEFGFTFPVLIDKQQVLVRLAGATATPEVALFSSAGKVLYRGRIDNRVEDLGQRRTVVTQHELRDALDAVLAGRPVPHPTTRVVGCAINYVTKP
jgi:peroxiredoxin